jgi:dipeptidyl aminopeptidase/acylaminoacyl peptidase
MARSDDGSVIVGPSSGAGTERTVWKFVASDTVPPAWSPDGRRLAVVITAAKYRASGLPTPPGLWVVNVDGSGAHHVSDTAIGPAAWDPSGTKITFLAQDQPTSPTMSIDTVAAAGGEPTVLATVPTAQFNTTSPLSFSPDGTTILFTETNAVAAPGSQVLAIPATGGTPRVLLNAAPPASFLGAVFSPDGKRFVVMVRCLPPTFHNYAQLDVANADGTGLVPLAIPAGADPCSPVTPPAVAKAAAEQLPHELEPTWFITGWISKIRP